MDDDDDDNNNDNDNDDDNNDNNNNDNDMSSSSSGAYALISLGSDSSRGRLASLYICLDHPGQLFGLLDMTSPSVRRARRMVCQTRPSVKACLIANAA